VDVVDEETGDGGRPPLGSGLDLRITLHKLDIFCQVVEAGGVTRAADQLILTQPVVTGHIRSLEDRLQTKLFTRSGRHNVLTEAGERTYHWGREILRAAQELHRELEELGDGARGSIAIAASMSAGSYLLPPLIARFARERPNVHVSLTVSDQAAAQEAVQVGDVDFAIAIGDIPPQPEWLEIEVIGVEELVLVGPPHDAREAPLDRKDLNDLRFVESPMSGRRRLAERRLQDLGVHERRIAIELGHPEAMKRAVEEGVGAAMLFRGSVQEDIERGSLAELRIEGADLSFPVLLLIRKDKVLSRAGAALLGEIRAVCAVGVPA
jgi:DNA-binding transcriptional LysR family regulator